MTRPDVATAIPRPEADQPAVGTPRVSEISSDAAPQVVVRSWSALTPFGDCTATWRGLLSGRFINDHAKSDAVAGPRRARQLAERAAIEAGGSLSADAAVVVGTSKGSVEDWLTGSPTSSGLADIAGHVAGALRLRGPRLTVSAACASGLHALIRGAMMVRSGEARQVLVVVAEASVHPMFLGSFQRLGVLAKPADGCRPFDRNRTGFYMSEAAAAVVLESADAGEGDDAEADGSPDLPRLVYLDRYALGGDATHLTGGDPELHTLRYLLARVIDGRMVDLVHAHGTGTPANDEAELAAIESALGEQATPPNLYSHKGALGHSLGAAGLLAVVINCHAHATGTVPPNVQTRDPLDGNCVAISRGVVRRPVRRSIAVAAGFGGAMGVVALASA